MDAHPFIRTELLFGPEAFRRLARAHVTVAGLGAVGSYAVEGLARCGIGRLTLIDFDTVQLSNINRQLFALHSTLGRRKTAVAAERVADIHPTCDVRPLDLFLNEDTVPAALEPAPDILIDAIDSLNSKVQLLAGAARRGLPVLSVMGAADRTDPSLLRVGDLADTHHCPLARFVRKRLGRLGIRSGIECVYSIEPRRAGRADIPLPDGEMRVVRGERRAPLPSFSCLTAIAGLTAARQAVARLTGP
jgi:tRNA threonylcarbamoyladenosine dehydratase